MSEHVAYPGCYCADCVEGTSPETVAWEWLDRMVSSICDEEPSDIAFSADQMVDAFKAGARTPSARITGDKDRENSVEGAPHYAMLQVSVALYDALRRNRIGWENAIDLDLLPERHRPAAQALIDEADTILKQWREVTL